MYNQFVIYRLDIPPPSNSSHRNYYMFSWLVVSTHLKNISQIGSSPQVGLKIKKN